MILALVLIVVTVLLFFLLVSFPIIGFFFGAPYYPSEKRKVEKMIKLANLKSGHVVVDLGSGDGRIVAAAAKIKGVESHGVEMNPILVLLSKVKFRKRKNIKMFRKNMWKVDLRKYDRIFLFCLSKEMVKFEKKLRDELKPGTLIISNIFRFPNWKPIKEEDNIFIYKA